MNDADREQYDQDFADAMLLKLRLNREARAKAAENTPPASVPSSASVSAPRLAPGFRDGVIEKTLAENPGLTYEEVDEGMRAMGF